MHLLDGKSQKTACRTIRRPKPPRNSSRHTYLFCEITRIETRDIAPGHPLARLTRSAPSSSRSWRRAISRLARSTCCQGSKTGGLAAPAPT